MNSGSQAEVRKIPDHVPPELVQDFSFHEAPGVDEHPELVIDRLRDHRDIVWALGARRGQDSWVFKSYDLIFEAFQNPELFSSAGFSGFSALLDQDLKLIPPEIDPPMHRGYRRILNALFSPSRMNALEAEIAATVRDLTDAVLPRGECDFQKEVATPLPTAVFLNLVGLPIEDAGMFLEWERLLLHSLALDQRAIGARGIRDYLVEAIRDREAHPREDVLTAIVQGEVDDRPLTADEKLGMCFNLYIAGLDTVASGLGATFRYLAENPERQAELRRDRERRGRAIEEIMRTHSMVVAGRFVTRDTAFHGVQLKKGDYVALPTMFANRDERQFDKATDVNFDRVNVLKHIVFGTGIHNCLGSHLARREMKIVVDEWLDRVPPFHITKGKRAVTYASTVVFGVETLPLTWRAD